MSRRSSSCSTRSRIRTTSARSCAAPRPPASTASCSRRTARRRSARLRSRRRPARSNTCCCARSMTSRRALSDLHARGVRIAGAEGDAPMTARQSDLRGPLAIVVGSEGQGLGPAVRRRADLFMRIPMKGAVGSLNAAVAGSILLFEALAQRDPNATPRVRRSAAPRRRPMRPTATTGRGPRRKTLRRRPPRPRPRPCPPTRRRADEAATRPTTEPRRPRARAVDRRARARACRTEPPDARPTAAESAAAEPAEPRRAEARAKAPSRIEGVPSRRLPRPLATEAASDRDRRPEHRGSQRPPANAETTPEASTEAADAATRRRPASRRTERKKRSRKA